MASITNNYAQGSCLFEAGSTQNGDVTGNITINQGGAGSDEKAAGKNSCTGSPVHLSESASKIDLIRVMNAWYECGKVQDSTGGKLTKKEFFTWVGKLLTSSLKNVHFVIG